VSIGITGVANSAFRATETEKLLTGVKPDADTLKSACEHAADGVIALEDIHASADYRLDLARIYTRRALEKAIERAG
jgi:carbon-monoxide dehydrogenase medium subunit